MEPGTRLGPYEIVAPIGAGGMGEVWKARDTRLERSVAIKILPAEFADDTKLRLRFEREAKTISQLNHPNICTLYDVGENYLVMELIEGETLGARIARGALPLPDVFRIGQQIAEALDRAHRAGVVHRDLKPGNVMLTKSGAKLLDFGLAKPAPPAVGASDRTLQKSLTEEGAIIGTFQYMAPEQLNGSEADARTDIFALGSVLYEMTTGRPAFEGGTGPSLIAAIVAGEPKPIAEIRPFTPRELEHIVARCIRKDREERWQSAYDVSQELRWIAERPPGPDVPSRSRVREWIGWALAAISVAAAVTVVAMRRDSPRPPVHLSFSPPENTSLFPFDELGLAVSPDGSRVAYTVHGTQGMKQLWIRDVSSGESRHLAGSEGASYPFWSPNGDEIAFFAAGKLKKMKLDGAPPVTIAEAPDGRGAAWGPDGTIVFSPRPTAALFRTTAAGGAVSPLTKLASDEVTHRWPSFIDRRHVLYLKRHRKSGDLASGSLNVVALDEGVSRQIASDVSNGVFMPPDLIVFARGSTLFAQRFDLESSALIGERVTILAESVVHYEAKNLAMFSIARDGTIAFIPQTSERTRLALVDRTGSEIELIAETLSNPFARMSADEHRIAFVQRESDGKHDVWVYDRRDKRSARVTFEGKLVRAPVWSPDGQELAFQHGEVGELARAYVTGGRPPQPFVTSDLWKVSLDYSSNGRVFLYQQQGASGGTELWVQTVDKRGTPSPFITGGRSHIQARFAPDGRHVVYAADATGRWEVYVRTFPRGEEQWQISNGGGVGPVWRADGREICYTDLNGMVMSVAVTTVPAFHAGSPQPLFATRGIVLDSDDDSPMSGVSRDGRLFLVRRSARPREQIDVVLGAFERLR